MMDGSLVQAIPAVRRARDYYVYGLDGKRYLDCYLNGGRALLGHRPPHVSTVVKDAVSQGVYAEYPSKYAKRLATALRRLIPTHPEVRHFPTFADALVAARSVLGAVALHDPALAPDPAIPPGAISVWRPFLDEDTGIDYSTAAMVLPIVPFPGAWAGQALCVRSDCAGRLPEPSPTAAVCLAAQVRALQALGGHPPAPPSLSLFEARGPYLRTRIARTHYPRVFYTFLEKGIILHPGVDGPSIWTSAWGSHEHKIFRALDRQLAGDLAFELSP